MTNANPQSSGYVRLKGSQRWPRRVEGWGERCGRSQRPKRRVSREKRAGGERANGCERHFSITFLWGAYREECEIHVRPTFACPHREAHSERPAVSAQRAPATSAGLYGYWKPPVTPVRARRRPAPGLVHHSDRGVQYASRSDTGRKVALGGNAVSQSHGRRNPCALIR